MPECLHSPLPPSPCCGLCYRGPWITFFQPENTRHSLPSKNLHTFVGPEGQVTWLPLLVWKLLRQKISQHFFHFIYSRSFKSHIVLMLTASTDGLLKGKICCGVQFPSYIPHLPTLEVFFTSYSLLSLHVYRYFSFDVVTPLNHNFLFFFCLKYKLVTPKTNSAGNTALHLQTNAETFIKIVLFSV